MARIWINSLYNNTTYISESTKISNQGREEDPPTKVDPQSTSVVSGSDRSSGGIVEEGEMCGTDFTTEKGGGRERVPGRNRGADPSETGTQEKLQVTTE